MTAVPSIPRLSRGTQLGYALGSVGTAAFGTVPGLLLLYYLTDVLGVAAGIAGLVVFAPKAWDVLLNPWIGSRSDRTESRWGPRRPWMLAGGVTLPLLFVLVFAGPGAPPALAAGWVAVTFLLAATAYGCFQVPYVAQPAEITDDPGERATLMSWRVAALALGILLAGAGAPAVVDAFGGGRGGYLAMAVFVALLLALGMLGAVAGTRRAPTLTRVRSEARLLPTLRLAWRSRPFRVLLAGFVLQALGIGVMLAGVPYYSEQVLGDPAAGTVLFVALVAPAILVMPLWLRVSRRLGKRKGLLLSAAVFVFGAGSVVVWDDFGPAGAYAAVVLVGIGYAGMQMFPLAMLPDVIAADEATSGQRRAGVFTGVWTAAETLGLAIGPGLLGGLLALAGYVSSTGDEVVTQGTAAAVTVELGLSVVPALLVLLSLPVLARYRLDPVPTQEVPA
ncbi:MFS transporter [Blastococcus saxobsidens]|uniref:Major facilitator superfamily transporter n=1 Tax=Blastococcus saxobsidens (strain DD2) TaxID=1146883 RepID=H6RJ70_BLASD|nr:MFS transporter [Blastococcus saxobsidens]CCG04815.1 Major facilitator superfamily transporter [Blastococcus saxobsidens DD2]